MLGPAMVFSSPTFLFLFLPVTLLGYVAVPARWRNAVLLLASVVFYVWGAGAAVAVLLYVALVALIGGRLVAHDRSRRILAALVVLLLTPLAFFKYLPPLAQLSLGHAPAWALPLGISFFTFHAISYVVDVHQRRIEPERSTKDLLLYLFLFPHQIAGPIVRYREIVTELKDRRDVTLGNLTYGCSRFTWGLAKKAFVADSAGVVADAAFAGQGTPNLATAWLGALAYAIQIYFDFSGYTDMAVGLAAMFGFRFPENFANPYRAIGPADFWRRWHMTLSRWFRDYLYIPLGGNRHGVRREYLALVITFTATALWHGAAWTFLVWGALHSAALLLERVTGLREDTRALAARRALTVAFVVLAWVPFRAPTLHRAVEIWHGMVAGGFGAPSPQVLLTLTPWSLLALGLGGLAAVGPRERTGFQWVHGLCPPDLSGFRYGRAVLVAPALLVVAVVSMLWLDFSPFLYFQF
ncbi:MBOAT family O-acyltransferase [Spongisporangium articulatum]|uniref:MBOAT family O-acyltransferase n=1 Tax=Spongisporangium articulatum TaxID=3362603 RepID=A0ABW8AS49_9ACTN